ncbi:MAG: tripartite tricarboxylate transporter substrate binding protein [Burkholderiaceae bacterium]
MLGIAAAGFAAPVHASDSYPSKPIRIVIGFAPGGNTDIFGRLFATHLQKNLGQPVIVENRPGAATMLAAQHVATSPPDGYTICLCVTNVATNRFAYAKVPYTMADFAPVALMFQSVTGLTVPSDSPFDSVRSLVQFARDNPGKLTYSTTGAGGATHLAGALFAATADITAVPVHYKGAAPAAMAILSKEVDYTFSTITTAQPALRDQRIRMLALAAPRRASALADVPTMAEVGLPEVVTSVWYGLLVPAGTPAQVIATLNREVAAFVGDKEINARFVASGELPRGDLSPEAFGKFIDEDTEHMRKIMEPLNLQLG